jgi:cytochrome P450
VKPVRAQSVDEIRLGDLEFWVRPQEEREGAFATLREEHPVSFHQEPELPLLPKGPGFWSLVRHADILHASRNADVFCSGRGTQIGDQPEAFNEAFGSMINMDDPRHGRLRRIVSRGFTPRMLKRLEGDVQRCAVEIVDGVIEKGECDFVTDIAARLPLRIICDMMGIPESQHDFIFERTNAILGAGDPEYGGDDLAALPGKVLMAGAELTQLVQELGRARVAEPTDDLTSSLVNAEIDGEGLTESELGSFFVLLVVAGNETTRNAISHGMKALCDFPEQRALWAADFEGVAPTAIEEIIRWASPVIHFRRTATRDSEIGGQKISEGDKVVLWYASGNRDEDAFDEPFRFDVRRTPNEHVAFGGPGPHHCIGAHLARREMTVMFRELFARLPDLQVTGPAERLQSMFIHGIKHMPCAFTPGRARFRGEVDGR